jgi:hypothetical protein
MVGAHQLGLLAKFLFDPAQRRRHRAVVKPIAHAEREEVFATIHAFCVEAEIFQGGASQARQFNREEPIAIEGMVLERIRSHLRFAQVDFAEIVEIDDEDAVFLQVRQIHLQRRGVHCDQHIDAVAGRVNVGRREVDLETADTGKSARRGANFGREVRQSGKVIAVKRHGICELAAGDLHAVAGVAAEANYSLFEDFTFAFCGRGRNNSTCGHNGQIPIKLDE